MANGLDDVVAAETVLSDVDGLGGRLTIRGHSLPELAGRWSYPQVVRLLLDGFFEDLPGDAELAAQLGEARVEVFERTPAFAVACWRRSKSTAPCAPAWPCCRTAKR